MRTPPPEGASFLSPHVVELLADRVHLEELLEHVPVGIVVHAANGLVAACNSQAAQMLGRDVDGMLHAPPTEEFWRFVGDDGRPMKGADYPVNRVLAHGQEIRNVVVGVPMEAAATRWMLCNAYPIFERAHTLTHVVVCFSEFTARREAEIELRKSEERFKLAIRGSDDAVWDWDMATGAVYFSDRFWQWLGREAEGDAAAAFWTNVHPDDVERVREALRDIVSGGADVFHVQFRLLPAEGGAMPVLARGHALRENGQLVRLAGTLMNRSTQEAVERQLYELAYLDALTHLPNRRALDERVAQAQQRSMRSGATVALILLDIDNFKGINDALGPRKGDLLLVEVARRLSGTMRAHDLLARVASDEFAVLIEELDRDPQTMAAQVAAIDAQLRSVLREPVMLGGESILLALTSGVTTCSGLEEDVDTLLRQATIAMHEAKRNGRKGLRFFEPFLQQTAERRRLLENALRHAFDGDEFQIYLQPQWNGARRLIGAEALLRWHSPVLGWVSPLECVAMAEATGLMGDLGFQILRKSCRLLAEVFAPEQWPDFRLAVNVSVVQLRSDAFVAQVRGLLGSFGVPPGRLQLEMTESVFAGDIDCLVASMKTLRADGISFALDDFGTGYSSLSYLTRLPIQILKIDRSFVHRMLDDPQAAAVVRAIITLATELGLDLLAEGVESEAQLQRLLALGCDEFQGFLFDPALPLGQFVSKYGTAAPQS